MTRSRQQYKASIKYLCAELESINSKSLETFNIYDHSAAVDRSVAIQSFSVLCSCAATFSVFSWHSSPCSSIVSPLPTFSFLATFGNSNDPPACPYLPWMILMMISLTSSLVKLFTMKMEIWDSKSSIR